MKNLTGEQRFMFMAGGLALLAVLFFSGIFSGLGRSAVLVESDTKAGEAIEANVKTFSAEITNRTYDPVGIDVDLGDTVVVNIKNNDNEQHGISLSSFGVNSFVAPLGTQQIRFIADKTGEAETFCSSDHGEKLLINVKT